MDSSRRTKVFLVDHLQLMRQALALLLQSAGMEVVGQAARPSEIPPWSNGERPDVVVTELGETDGEAIVDQLLEVCQEVPLLVLTGVTDERVVLAVVDKGAAGFVLKTVTPEELVRAVEDVRQGGVHVDPRMTRGLIWEVQRRASPPQNHSHDHLTARELDVLTLASQGFSNRQIADQLSLSESTVKTHLRSLYSKFAVTDRTQAVLHALKTGVIPPIS